MMMVMKIVVSFEVEMSDTLTLYFISSLFLPFDFPLTGGQS